MSLFIGKLLVQAAYQLAISIWLMLVACILAWRGGRRVCAMIALTSAAILWLSSMPVTATSLMTALESQFTPVPMGRIPKVDAIVVLGGGVGAAVPPRLEPDLAGAADRVWYAARLYHAGKAPIILAVGGGIPWLGPKTPEADAMQYFLAAWGGAGKCDHQGERQPQHA
ncbi:hypothetical protein D6779_03725 [Candidatus Parcubacteria bacterium]|nr:MAG: hypothetical protein D6779_03725 [Candidatus Parcubacteria bacterium]